MGDIGNLPGWCGRTDGCRRGRPPSCGRPSGRGGAAAGWLPAGPLTSLGVWRGMLPHHNRFLPMGSCVARRRPQKNPSVRMGRKGAPAPFVVPPTFRAPRPLARGRGAGAHAHLAAANGALRGALLAGGARSAGLGGRARGWSSPRRAPGAALSHRPPCAVGAPRVLVPLVAYRQVHLQDTTRRRRAATADGREMGRFHAEASPQSAQGDFAAAGPPEDNWGCPSRFQAPARGARRHHRMGLARAECPDGAVGLAVW
jgi:hypothetical protein